MPTACCDFSAATSARSANFWNANIFYPEPLTLAYSEHLFAQAVQILPVYALTGNIILSYNLLFLSTFVLSGLGMFLFVREITGSARAGLVAGLIYAFAPYRVPQFSHLQVISSQWMPFVLYGLRRYFVTRRITTRSSAPAPRSSRRTCRTGISCCSSRRSCWRTRSSRSRRAALDATRACGWRSRQRRSVVTAVTLPFLLPYLELRRLGFGPRALNEVKAFSADVFSYWTSPAESWLWGGLIRAYPKAEGDLFPTIAALLLGAVGVAGSVSAAWARARARPAAASRRADGRSSGCLSRPPRCTRCSCC